LENGSEESSRIYNNYTSEGDVSVDSGEESNEVILEAQLREQSSEGNEYVDNKE
jgi:hypothetical protein